MRDFKFHDKYYVGFQKNRYSQAEVFRMLGFATPNTGDHAFKKRKETVDGWSDKNLSPMDIDNKPIHGFKIVDTVSRYSTSNKMFRVEDPRGFELEIDVYNLLDIIERHTIVQGAIMEPMLWCRQGGTNFLISGNSEEYKHHVSGPKATSLDPGMYFKNRAGNVIYRFEGRLAYNLVGADLTRTDPYEIRNRSYYGYSWNRTPRTDFSGIKTVIKTIVNRKQDKPAFVYSEFSIDAEGKTKPYQNYYRKDVDPILRGKIVIRKTDIKDLIPVDVSEIKCDFIKSFKVPLATKMREVSYDYYTGRSEEKIKESYYTIEMNMSAASQTAPVLFKTKKESLEHEYTAQELIDFFDPIKYQQRRYSSDYHWGDITYVHEDIKS